jgi:hypothetical protein
MRYEMEYNRLYVSTRAFQKWCNDNQVSLHGILARLRKLDIYDGLRTTKDMTIGVDSLPTTRLTCFVFELEGTDLELDPNRV